jgi:hypothetical protein
MKFALALQVVFVSLSVLAAAKHEFKFVRQEHNHHHHHHHDTTTTTTTTTTTYSSGWVQNPSGKASFTAYSGCQYACKLSAYFHPSPLDHTLSVMFSCSVRPKSEWVLCCSQ